MRLLIILLLVSICIPLLGQSYFNQKGEQSHTLNISYSDRRLPEYTLDYTAATRPGLDLQAKLGYSSESFVNVLNLGTALDYYLLRQENRGINLSLGAAYDYFRISGFGEIVTGSIGSLRSRIAYRVNANQFYLVPMIGYQHGFDLNNDLDSRGIIEFGSAFAYTVSRQNLISLTPKLLYSTDGGDPVFEINLGYTFGRTAPMTDDK